MSDYKGHVQPLIELEFTNEINECIAARGGVRKVVRLINPYEVPDTKFVRVGVEGDLSGFSDRDIVQLLPLRDQGVAGSGNSSSNSGVGVGGEGRVLACVQRGAKLELETDRSHLPFLNSAQPKVVRLLTSCVTSLRQYEAVSALDPSLPMTPYILGLRPVTPLGVSVTDYPATAKTSERIRERAAKILATTHARLNTSQQKAI